MYMLNDSITSDSHIGYLARVNNLKWEDIAGLYIDGIHVSNGVEYTDFQRGWEEADAEILSSNQRKFIDAVLTAI